MRSFIAASFILIFICVMILLNTLFVTQKTDALLVMCCELRQNSSASAVELLHTEWQSCRDIIGLSVHRSDLERAENAIAALQVYTHSEADFLFHLSVLEAALHHIADNQRLTVDSVF